MIFEPTDSILQIQVSPLHLFMGKYKLCVNLWQISELGNFWCLCVIMLFERLYWYILWRLSTFTLLYFAGVGSGLLDKFESELGMPCVFFLALFYLHPEDIFFISNAKPFTFTNKLTVTSWSIFFQLFFWKFCCYKTNKKTWLLYRRYG